MSNDKAPSQQLLLPPPESFFVFVVGHCEGMYILRGNQKLMQIGTASVSSEIMTCIKWNYFTTIFVANLCLSQTTKNGLKVGMNKVTQRFTKNTSILGSRPINASM